MRIFQNKFFIICLSVAIAIAGITSTFSLMGYRSLSRNIVGTLATPFRLVATAVTNAVEGFGKYFSGIEELTNQNEALRQENAALKE